eukprot:1468490-Prymnesium_polylepis.3
MRLSDQLQIVRKQACSSNQEGKAGAHIVCLQVPVEHSTPVEVRQSGGELPQPAEYKSLWDRLVSLRVRRDDVSEGSSFGVAHHDAQKLFVRKGKRAPVLDDVLVLQ